LGSHHYRDRVSPRRFRLPPATVGAFSRAFEVARVDEQLLEHLLVAAACLVAQTQDVTPRGVFEQFFRRSVSDDEWRDRYAPLLG